MHLVLKNKRLYAGVYATHWVQTWRNSLLSFFVFTCTTALKSRSVSFQSTPSPRTSIIPIIPPRKSPTKKHGVLKFLPKLLAMDCPVVIFVHKVYCPCLIVHVFAHACFLCFAGDWGSFHRHLGAICSFASSLWLFSSLSKHNDILQNIPRMKYSLQTLSMIDVEFEKYPKIMKNNVCKSIAPTNDPNHLQRTSMSNCRKVRRHNP